MDLFTAIFTRKSIRSFLPDDVEDSKLRRILEAARAAPSWGNKQPWYFIVVKDEGLRLGLSETLHERDQCREGIATAPVTLVCCVDPAESATWEGKEYALVDGAIAMQHAVLAADALGLGSCWVGWFYEKQVKEQLDIPRHIRVLALTPLGYAAENPDAPPRREVGEISCVDKWSFPE